MLIQQWGSIWMPVEPALVFSINSAIASMPWKTISSHKKNDISSRLRMRARTKNKDKQKESIVKSASSHRLALVFLCSLMIPLTSPLARGVKMVHHCLEQGHQSRSMRSTIE